MKKLLLWGCVLLLGGCAFGVRVEQAKDFSPRTHPQTIFIVPFTTIMVPAEVSEGLFDRFVDALNAAESPAGLEYVILKQGLDGIDPAWLAKRDYVTGEVFAYVEDVGSTTASIRAKSRISLYQPGGEVPTLQLDYPVEVFYEKDYLSLVDARRRLAARISDSMAEHLRKALAGN